MSRIGKNPIPIPKGVEVKKAGDVITVKGPKGTLTRSFLPEIEVLIDNGEIRVQPLAQNRRSLELWGLTRSLIANMVNGVTEGFTKELLISGVGYRADLQGKNLMLHLGYSNPVSFPIPQGIEINVEDRQTRIIVTGIDKELVGETAAQIRAVRPPNPYKAKGVQYSDERIRRKVGKAAIGTAGTK